LLQSASALEFLEANQVDLSVKSQLGGHQAARTRRNKSGPNIGFAIISALQNSLKSQPNIEVKTSAKVSSIDQKGITITYQIADQTHQIQSKALILTTGGFAANTSLLQKYKPSIASLPTTNGTRKTETAKSILKPNLRTMGKWRWDRTSHNWISCRSYRYGSDPGSSNRVSRSCRPIQ
jgi:hypothetical protein